MGEYALNESVQRNHELQSQLYGLQQEAVAKISSLEASLLPSEQEADALRHERSSLLFQLEEAKLSQVRVVMPDAEGSPKSKPRGALTELKSLPRTPPHTLMASTVALSSQRIAGVGSPPQPLRVSSERLPRAASPPHSRSVVTSSAIGSRTQLLPATQPLVAVSRAPVSQPLLASQVPATQMMVQSQ